MFETSESGVSEQSPDQPSAAAGDIPQTALAAPLRPEQRTALEALAVGKSIAQTSRAIGVGRATIYRWLKTDAAFAAAYNQWQEEIEESSRSRLLTLTGAATDALRKALKSGDARSALALLNGLGLLRPGGDRLTDAEEITRRRDLDKKKRRIEMDEEERKLEADARIGAAADREIEAILGGPVKTASVTGDGKLIVRK